jgi:hypothetical protein
LWQHIQAGNTPDWDSGKAFEYLILRAFELEGAEVRYPYRVRFDGRELEQIDGLVYMPRFICMLESKDWQERINYEPIAKLRSQLARRPPGILGVIFSTYGFTPAAIDLARQDMPRNILLWEGSEVTYALHKSTMTNVLARKYQYAVENGIIHYNVTVEAVE